MRQVEKRVEGRDRAVGGVGLDFQRLEAGIQPAGKLDRASSEPVSGLAAAGVTDDAVRGDDIDGAGDIEGCEAFGAAGIAESARAGSRVHLAGALVERVDQAHALDRVAVILKCCLAEKTRRDRLIILDRVEKVALEDQDARVVEHTGR